MQTINIKSLVLTIPVLLVACGGDGGGDGGTTDNQSPPSTTTPTTSSITVQGHAPALAADPLTVIFMGPDGSSSNLFAGNNALLINPSASAASLSAISGGGYSAINDDNMTVSLTHGTVADVSGTADYQIGRWTNGEGQGVTAMSANRGAYYVVGTPLKLQPDASGGTFTCQLGSATAPTDVSGAVPPGTLKTASATIDKATLQGTLNLSFSIGSDNTPASTTFTAINGEISSHGVAAVTGILGSDATHPNLAVIYTVAGQNVAQTSGSVVLSCQ